MSDTSIGIFARFDMLDVELWCGGGAPAHHSGYINARIPISIRTAVLHNELYKVEKVACNIVFDFSEDEVIVNQIGSQCGFGGNVWATGVYHLEDHAKPEFDCLPQNEEWCDPRDG